MNIIDFLNVTIITVDRNLCGYYNKLLCAYVWYYYVHSETVNCCSCYVTVIGKFNYFIVRFCFFNIISIDSINYQARRTFTFASPSADCRLLQCRTAVKCRYQLSSSDRRHNYYLSHLIHLYIPPRSTDTETTFI